jgi:hypothetical protein
MQKKLLMAIKLTKSINMDDTHCRAYMSARTHKRTAQYTVMQFTKVNYITQTIPNCYMQNYTQRYFANKSTGKRKNAHK